MSRLMMMKETTGLPLGRVRMGKMTKAMIIAMMAKKMIPVRIFLGTTTVLALGQTMMAMAAMMLQRMVQVVMTTIVNLKLGMMVKVVSSLTMIVKTGLSPMMMVTTASNLEMTARAALNLMMISQTPMMTVTPEVKALAMKTLPNLQAKIQPEAVRIKTMSKWEWVRVPTMMLAMKATLDQETSKMDQMGEGKVRAISRILILALTIAKMPLSELILMLKVPRGISTQVPMQMSTFQTLTEEQTMQFYQESFPIT